MRMRLATLGALALLACGGSDSKNGSDGGDDGLPPDAATAGSFVAFTSPMEGQVFTRMAGAGGAVVAAIPFAVRASADVASVEYVAEDLFSLGEAPAPGFALSYPFMGDGDRFVVAHGKDVAGQEVASARVGFVVKGPLQTGSTCRDRLDSLGVTYRVGPAMMGVSDPVTVTLPLNGLKYSYSTSAASSTLFMDCTLALALHHMADLAKPLGVVQIVHLGIYNYRCIGGGTVGTGCSVSQHAYAKAIDLNTFLTADGTSYKVTTDFIIDGTTLPTATPTCSASGLSGKNLWLHMTACLLHAQKVFAIILTPNYNTDHRDHFHVDLTAGSDFIHATDPSAVGVDPPRALGDD